MEKKPMIEIQIRWGEGGTEDRLVETFKFATKPEADAFMTGVGSAEGWTGYSVLHDNRSGKDVGSERGLPVW